MSDDKIDNYFLCNIISIIYHKFFLVVTGATAGIGRAMAFEVSLMQLFVIRISLFKNKINFDTV